MDNNNNKTESLFGEHDVRHSVKTVEACWGEEMKRRRRLMLKTVLPLVVVVVCSWLGTAWKCKWFPFQEEVDWESVMEEKDKAAMNARPRKTYGFQEAKVRVKIITRDPAGMLPPDLEGILQEFYDTRPSEFYVELWVITDLTRAKQEELKGTDIIMFFNDKPEMLLEDGSTVKTIGDIPDMPKPKAIAYALNAMHKTAYGDDKPVVDYAKYQADKERELKALKAHKTRDLPDVVAPGDMESTEGGNAADEEKPIVLPLPKLKVENVK